MKAEYHPAPYGEEQGGGWLIFCPACKSRHAFDLKRWTFNGDPESPTFEPSFLIKGTEPLTQEQIDDWQQKRKPLPTPKPRICHSFVRNGKIEFLGDCTHEFAGQTIELEDI